ncbi:hypothetical protein ACWCXE_04915 [Streptomyces sp. NPDC001780]
MKTQDDHLQELYGLPAFTFPPPGETARLPEPDAVAWRVGHERWSCREVWEDTFDRFRAEVDLTRVRALITGVWGDPEDTPPCEVIEALLAVRDRLPALRSLFLGDITDKECKLSRIAQADVAPLLAGFPALEEFGVRAGDEVDAIEWGGDGEARDVVLGLRFPALRHDSLRRLVAESGGLSADVPHTPSTRTRGRRGGPRPGLRPGHQRPSPARQTVRSPRARHLCRTGQLLRG